MSVDLFTNRSRSGVLAILGLVGLLGAASVFVQMTRDQWYHTDRPAEQILYVRSPETVRRMALSYDALAADVYWIRAVQHFGGSRLGASRYELLYPLLDMATSLDPRFNIAYRFGSLFLAEPAPGGPGRPDQAIALLRKGIKEMPWKWHYYQDTGYVYYFRYNNYAAAADWFKRASEVEGAPYFLKPLAANTLAKGQNRAASRVLYKAIAETAENDFMKNDAIRRLRQLDTMDDMDLLRQIVRQYRERVPAGRLTWQAVIASRLLRFVPRDRDGFDYVLDPATGEVRLSEDSTLLPLPTESPAPDGSSPPSTPPAAVPWPSPTGLPPLLESRAPLSSFAS